MELLEKTKLLNKQNKLCSFSELQGKLIGLYFSASWSPPCQQFTSLLAKVHKELGNRCAPFQIIYVPCDKTVEDMKQYYGDLHGNWLTIEFNDEVIPDLQKEYDITMVPKLIVIDHSGLVISGTGRKDVADKGVAAFRNWADRAKLVTAVVDNVDE